MQGQMVASTSMVKVHCYHGNLSEQVVASARYRAQAPLIDQLMQEVGLSEVVLKRLVNGLLNQTQKL